MSKTKQLSVHAVIQATRKEHFHNSVSAVRPEGRVTALHPRGLKSVRKQLQQELVQAAMGTSPIARGMERLGSSPEELSLGLSPEGQVVVN